MMCAISAAIVNRAHIRDVLALEHLHESCIWGVISSKDTDWTDPAPSTDMMKKNKITDDD